MSFQNEPGRITWKLHLASAPRRVYEMLSTDEGRSRFWAEKTEEQGDELIFHLLNQPGRIQGRILKREPERCIVFEYFAGSRAAFHLESDGKDGCILTMEASDVDERWRMEMSAGWVTVLMALKAACDFNVDLRNHDPRRTWDQGFVDD